MNRVHTEMDHRWSLISATSQEILIELESAQIDQNMIQQEFTHDHTHDEYPIIESGDDNRTISPRGPAQYTSSPTGLSVVLEFINEGDIARYALTNLINIGADSITEIYAVDNLSVDDTFAQLSSLEDPRIKLIKFTDKFDYGSTLNHVIPLTSSKYVLLTEPFIAELLTTLSPVIYNLQTQSTPVVFISRTKKHEYGRTWMVTILSFLIYLMYHIRIKDPFPPAIACSGALIRSITSQIQKSNFDLALIQYLSQRNITPVEIPLSSISYQHPGVTFIHRSPLYWIKTIFQYISKRLAKL